MSVCRLHVMPIVPSTAPIPKVLTNAHVLRDLFSGTERKRNVIIAAQVHFHLLYLKRSVCEFNNLLKIFII